MRLIQVGNSKNDINTEWREILKLEKRCGIFPDQYRCSLTKELDVITNMSNTHYYNTFHHYILVSNWGKNEHFLHIRVPGRTVGCIYYDDNNIITKVSISTNYVDNEYSSNMKELVQKYVGELIEW